MKKTEIVVITGASAGLGRAIAREFAKRRASIGLIARDEKRLKTTAKEVETLGGRALIFPIDVSDFHAIEKAALTVEKTFGPIDIWINNAMVSVFSPADQMTPEEYRRVTEVTYLGYVWGTLSALKFMNPRNRGTILQIGSALAYRAIPLQSAYCAAKHAVQGFTESIRSELIHDNRHIKISMIQLPALNTPHFRWAKSRLARKPHPMPPIYQPEVIARAIVFACFHYRREWYIGFSTLITIWGNHFLSGFGDWFLAHRYKDQEYDDFRDPNAPDNLFETVHDSSETQGDFESEAKNSSFYIRLNQRRGWFLLALLLLLLTLILFTSDFK